MKHVIKAIIIIIAGPALALPEPKTAICWRIKMLTPE